MAGGLGLGSLFGTAANASGIGNLLGGVTSGLGSGLLGGQTIGGGDASQTIADALGWSYGLGDQTGSTEAQVALGDAGPTAMGTAQQYMQNQQQQNQPDARTQLDQGQGTPAQRALAAQPAVSMAQAYGPEGPWAPGGSSAPGAAAQGPQAPTQVAGPAAASTANAPPLGTQTPPGGYVAPERSAVTSYGSPVTGNAISGQYSPDQWQAAKQQMRSMVGAPAPGQVPMPQPRPAEADYNEIDAAAGQGNVPLPQPRTAATDAAPAPFRAASTPASRTIFPPAAATPPAANDPVARATTPPAVQGAVPQNPIQGIMQALGLTNLPPQMQQAAQQIIRQVLGQLMPQLQGLMGGQQPYGGGQGQAIDPRTGQPPINPKTGQPYPAGTRWDQIAWSQDWDPSKQQQGVPWKQWENVPGSRPVHPGNTWRDTEGNWHPMPKAWQRDPSESGAPTARPAGDPYAPDPSKPDYHDPREWKYNPSDKTWGPHHSKKPPPGINVAANLPNRSMEAPMSPDEIRKEEMRGMTPQQLKKLRERIRKMHGRTMLAQARGAP